MQNNTNDWPLTAHTNSITIYPRHQNERESTFFHSLSPTLLITRQKDKEYFLYQETHNKVLSQINERASDIPNPDSNNIRIATGEEATRRYLILKALDTRSSQEVKEIGIFLSRNRLVRLWLQNLLDDAEEMKMREGKVVTYRWRDVVEELVVGNKIVRGLLTGLLLNEREDGSWEVRLFLDGDIAKRVESFSGEMRG